MEQIEIDNIVLRCIINAQNIERNPLDFPKLLSATNPFTLFDDMTHEDVVDKILFKHKEKSEETIRGNLIECIAIEINNKIQAILRGRSIESTLRYVDYYQFVSGNGYDINYKHSTDYRATQYSSYMLDKVGVNSNDTRMTQLYNIFNNNNTIIFYFGNQIFNDSFIKRISNYNIYSFTFFSGSPHILTSARE